MYADPSQQAIGTTLSEIVDAIYEVTNLDHEVHAVLEAMFAEGRVCVGSTEPSSAAWQVAVKS